MDIQDIMAIIEGPRGRQRFGEAAMLGIDTSMRIRCYHATTRENAERIMAEGLRANSSHWGFGLPVRPPAVYVTLSLEDAERAADILGIKDAVVVCLVLSIREIFEDGLMDGPFWGYAPSSIMYLGDIPASRVIGVAEKRPA